MLFAESGNSKKRCPGKSSSGVLKKEQKKLEKMILESFKQGGANLGNNEYILRQSTKVDKLIVNEMLKTDYTGSKSVAKK
jgi:hypothetical protein